MDDKIVAIIAIAILGIITIYIIGNHYILFCIISAIAGLAGSSLKGKPPAN